MYNYSLGCQFFSNHFVQGVTGYEGAFRKSCEATMKVLRQDSDALIWYVCVCLIHIFM